MSKLAILFVLIIVTVTSLYWFPENLGYLAYKSDGVKSMFDFDVIDRGNGSGIDFLSLLRGVSETDNSTVNDDWDDIELKSADLTTTSLPVSKTTSIEYSTDGRPLILEWNLFCRRSLFKDKTHLEKHCPFKCAYTTNRTLVDDAAVTVHHMGGGDADGQRRSTNRSFVSLFLNFEPPPHRPKYQKTRPYFFDYTITYRQDSDLPVYYDSFVPLSGPNDIDRWTDAEVDAALKSKQKPALWMVSHCSTASKRETYVAQLKKHMAVHQIGACNNVNCPRFKDCEKEFIKTHYFYIAFENSVCNDYITEKFFRMRELIVPIVLDRRVFRGIHEKLLNYTIVASDYESPQQLAEYLKFLMDHPDEYRKYFDWTKIYKKSPQPFVNNDTACKICQLANQVQTGTFEKKKLNIHEWWGGKNCYGPVGSDLVKRGKSVKD
uniref:Fucosyltransferase n=1 Tax=Panagrellus redivivus TaxID=6233 RepID=A0A7E4ZWB1_PANRE